MFVRNSSRDRVDRTEWNELRKEAARHCTSPGSLCKRTTLEDCILSSEFHRRQRHDSLPQFPLERTPRQTLNIYERRRRPVPTFGSGPFQSETRTVQPGACHFASAEFPLYLPLLPTLCGRPRKAAFPPRKASEIFPGALPLSPVHAQSSPDAGGILQIWATGSSCAYFSPLGTTVRQEKKLYGEILPVPKRSPAKYPEPPAHPRPRCSAPGVR